MMRRIGPKFKFADGWFDSFRWLQGVTDSHQPGKTPQTPQVIMDRWHTYVHAVHTSMHTCKQ